MSSIDPGLPRLGSGRAEELRLEIPRDTYYLASIRYLVRDAARHAGFAVPEADQIQVAVDEACAVATAWQGVAMDDARAPSEDRVSLRIRSEARRLVIKVIDHRPPASLDESGDVEGDESPWEQDGGGMGFLIISSFMDEVAFARTDEGYEIVLTRYRRQAPSERLRVHD